MLPDKKLKTKDISRRALSSQFCIMMDDPLSESDHVAFLVQEMQEEILAFLRPELKVPEGLKAATRKARVSLSAVNSQL